MNTNIAKKREKGIMATDAMIAILIIILFSGIIISMITGIVIESTKVKIISKHVNIITKVFEYIEKTDFEDVTETNLVNYINGIDPENISSSAIAGTLSTLYRVNVDVNYYIPEDDETYFNVIKIITLNVENTLNNKTYNTQMSRIKKANTQELKNIVEQ